MTAEEKEQIWPERPRKQGAGVAEALNDVQRVVAVVSGKSGVGESSVAALLAVALQRQGNRVGLLDADITWPNQSEEMAEQVNAPFLGRLALDLERARRCEAGEIEGYRGATTVPIAEQIADWVPEEAGEPILARQALPR